MTKVKKMHSDSKGTVLAANLEELITRDPRRFMRSFLAQERNVFRTTVRTMVAEDMRYKVYAMRRV
jgi:hypothetical protein